MDSDNKPLEPLHIKGGLWLQYFGHSNSFCTRATRAITNYAPIGKYRLRFFSNEEFKCLCGYYPIESKQHILYECKRFNEYWNLHKNSITHFIMFLEHNHNAFASPNDITVVATTYYNDKWPHKAVNLLILDLEWKVHKRTQQEVSAKLESYIYKVLMVHATNN